MAIVFGGISYRSVRRICENGSILLVTQEGRHSLDQVLPLKRISLTWILYHCSLKMDRASNQKEDMIFMGNPGVGKTHLANALGLEATK